MAKFYGHIGYVRSDEVEVSPGVYEGVITERPCMGDILRNTKRWENSEKVNSDLTLDNRFSIIVDEFAINNMHNMRYLKYNGTSWCIKSFEIERPRVILTVGGVYHG